MHIGCLSFITFCERTDKGSTAFLEVVEDTLHCVVRRRSPACGRLAPRAGTRFRPRTRERRQRRHGGGEHVPGIGRTIVILICVWFWSRLLAAANDTESLCRQFVVGVGGVGLGAGAHGRQANDDTEILCKELVAGGVGGAAGVHGRLRARASECDWFRGRIWGHSR